MTRGLIRRMATLCLFACSAATLAATEPRSGGLNELVILDPGVHPEGLPAVVVKREVGRTTIDIPPKIHVHRYYYSGNKEYQGPFVTGGPTIVVANNPWNGERMYIDVMLPAGFPIISYDKKSITYIYRESRVFITFSCLCREKAVVTYASGRGVERCAHELKDKACAHTKKSLQECKLVGTVKNFVKENTQVAAGATMAAGAVANTAVETVQKVAAFLPGYQSLKSLGERRLDEQSQEGTRRAQEALDSKELKFVKTLR